MQVVMIGPFMLKLSLLMLAAAAAAGYAVPFFLTKRLEPDRRKPLMDDLVTALLIGILVWKFSVIVFDPHSVIRSPRSLLYFTGGTEGLILGAIIGAMIPVYKCLKYRKPWAAYANAALAWLAAGYGIWNLLRVFFDGGGASSIASAVVSAAVVTFQLRRTDRMFSGYHFVVSVLWLSIGWFAASLLGGAPDEAWWLGFTGMQLCLIAAMILAFSVKVTVDAKRKSNDTKPPII
ncbi:MULTISPECIES: hypothetical protein [Paenibacillus]|uniref:Prolipoprotein diacylglyceryl transferase n=1 Tax=Paenibacillus albilobatus TaxID=2716884 RepID=A0A920C931_9BACL|nr:MULTISPECIES: hypothetical protein [Paenibacillus]GIO29353.1 hypothetical protein J2TS6_04940 [Paenibacillus albilobatus]